METKLPVKRKLFQDGHTIMEIMFHFYKDKLEDEKMITKLLTEANIQLKNEQSMLQRQYDLLEDYANEQETRGDILHSLVEEMIDRTTGEIRNEMGDAIQQISREHDIDLGLDWEEGNEPENIDLTDE